MSPTRWVGFSATAVAGAQRTLDEAVDEPPLAFSVDGTANTAGFVVEGHAGPATDGAGFVAFDAERDPSTRSWAWR